MNTPHKDMKQKNEEKRECINCLKCVRQHRKDIFCEDESCVCHTYAVSPTPPSDNYIYAENIPLNKLQEILTTLEGK